MVNIDIDSKNPYVSLMLERPIVMTTNFYGNQDINLDFEYNKNYNLLMNF